MLKLKKIMKCIMIILIDTQKYVYDIVIHMLLLKYLTM